MRPLIPLFLSMGALACTRRAEPPAPGPVPAWELLAGDLPAALLSVDGASASDILAVGADKGAGPLVLHFNGTSWTQLETGQRGDLWWVHAFKDGSALMGGSSALVLRYRGGKFERLVNPAGLGRQTVYGIWGPSLDEFYAVGSSAGRDGFVWHYQNGQFRDEPLPAELPLATLSQPPGFFKVWGKGADVWVVGAAGAMLHRRGSDRFELVPTGKKDTLFTVHGAGARLLAVGGGSNGVVLEWPGFGVGPGKQPPPWEAEPAGAPLIQGVCAGDDGDWASGERGSIYFRKGDAPFKAVEHGLALPESSSLHSIFEDASHGVWAVGGNVLTPALDGGVLVHFGPPVPAVPEPRGAVAKSEPAASECPAGVVSIARDKSIARRWDEQALVAIRLDLPRPPVHARNLFHVSAAMWDAWAAYDASAKGIYLKEKHATADPDDARKKAISYAAFRVLSQRYENAKGGPRTMACLRAVMKNLDYDPADTHLEGDDPIAVGNRIAHELARRTDADGSNQAEDYKDPKPFVSPNLPLVYDNPGAEMTDPNVWQAINLSVAATQNGIILPAGVQDYIGSQWGAVAPFAHPPSSWPDKPPKLGPAMKAWITEVVRKQSLLDPTDGATMDISPGAYGHNPLGTNDGKGWGKNPVTGKAYEPQVVPVADFGRVMAEFWADGPDSETPPGHWNVIANQVADSPALSRRLFGRGPSLDPLSWDVHVYMALNGAEHDAAIAAWGMKRKVVTSRPISLIRWMGRKGQSTNPGVPSYDPDGLPLVPGLIEVITAESSAPGQRHEHLSRYIGQITVRGWLGEPGDRKNQVAGVVWIRAVDWVPYQRRTFVTPAFPGYISGHSTFSRAGAEVLTSLTGSPYFPGGFGEYVAPEGKFLQFEKGPSRTVRLQWAAYSDASDEAGQSRLWGGIHIAPDDFSGRRLGYQVGRDAVKRAASYFGAPPGI